MTRPGRLFWKYVTVVVALVGGALLASGLVEIHFSYRENKEALIALQREKALGAAARIDGFIEEIEGQIGWTTQPVLVAPECRARAATAGLPPAASPGPHHHGAGLPRRLGQGAAAGLPAGHGGHG